MKKLDDTADKAAVLTLKLSKFCRDEPHAAVVMACAGMIGHGLAGLPPGRRKIVRASLDNIIDDFIEEWKRR